MSETEYIDLFPGSSPKDNSGDQMGYHFEDEIYNPGRSRINDYKHSSSTIQKGNTNLNGEIEGRQFGSGEPSRNPDRKKTYLNISDERIVWAGAIFVFFGVFVFLIGYWLGKTTMKDITFTNKQAVVSAEEKLEQKKIENSLSAGPLPIADNNKNETSAMKEERNVTALPEGSDLAAPVANETREPAIKAPPIVASKTDKTPMKNVKLSTSSVKKTAMKTEPKSVKTVSLSGDNYTLQISAHTSMDKARSIEDNLRRIGFQSYIVEAAVNGITYYRVRVGKFGNKQEAQSALSKVKSTSMGKDSYILNLN